MSSRIEFESLIKELSGVSHQYINTLPQLESELNLVPQKMNEFSVYIPVIGMFSAGKSSLLNAWLEKDLLPEDQDATTAIATELHFAQNTSMRIFLDDTESKEVSQLPQDAEQANADEVSNGAYAVCTTNSARLKQLNGIIPIDMPGTDSDIQRHTEALYRYVHKGNAYLLVLDAGSGTIPASLMAFLNELNLMD
jgi:predicted GTPase